MEKRKSVLIITYYWPPSGGSGVQRWLKFSKYLPEFGWQPFIFTPENPSFDITDPSLEKDVSPEVEVIKLPIWEPYSIIDKLTGKQSRETSSGEGKKGVLAKALLWLRGNLFIPDPRLFWIKPSVKVLQDLLVSNKIDTIVTTGPPHSMHLIGLRLKNKCDIKWVADFRDPWTTWVLYERFYLSAPVRRIHRSLERKVLTHADAVIAASPHYAEELAELGKRKVDVITNGFDESDFSQSNETPETFIIRHVGIIDELRNPMPVVEAVNELVKTKGYKINIEFVGKVASDIKEEIRSNPDYKEFVSFKPYIAHDKILKIYKQSAMLLLVPFRDMPGNIPGKLFEYIASERPVLYIGPEGDAARIIRASNLGMICEADDSSAIKDAIASAYQNFKEGDVAVKQDISKYSRKNITKNLVEILNNL